MRALLHITTCSITRLALERLTRYQIRNLLVVISALFLLPVLALILLHALVALGQLAEAGQAVWAKLVEDARDELGKLFVFAVAVQGEGVGGERGLDWVEC